MLGFGGSYIIAVKPQAD